MVKKSIAMTGFFLLVFALVSSIVLFPIAFIYAILKNFFISIDRFFYAIAFSLDQSANVVCSELFNDVLLKRKSKKYFFGDPDKTISFVLGKNYMNGTLNFAGKLLTKILNFIDKDHVLKAVNHDEKK